MEIMPPDRFTSDEEYGYNFTKIIIKAILMGAWSINGVSDSQYIHGLMLNEDDTLDNELPHCGYTFKARSREILIPQP